MFIIPFPIRAVKFKQITIDGPISIYVYVCFVIRYKISIVETYKMKIEIRIICDAEKKTIEDFRKMCSEKISMLGQQKRLLWLSTELHMPDFSVLNNRIWR